MIVTMQGTISITRYPWRQTTPWAVNIPATIGGKRKREFYRTRRDAERRGDELAGLIRHKGIDALRTDSMSVHEAMESYLAAKVGVSSKRHFEGLIHYGGVMREAWGRLPVSSLSVREVEKLLERPSWGPRTRWNALGYVRGFLSWCERRDLISSNPAKKLAAEMSRPYATKQILSPDEMALLLRLTRRDPMMRAFIVLGGFVGIRTAEIQRMNWDDISHGEIHIRPEAMKKTKGWRERYVKIEPALERHFPKPGIGPIIPFTVRAFGIRQRKLRSRMARVLARVRWASKEAERWSHDWPDNCLRHSFASYHLAIRCARKRGQTLTQFATEALYSKVEHITLTSDDYRRIAEATAKAERTRRRVTTDTGDDGQRHQT